MRSVKHHLVSLPGGWQSVHVWSDVAASVAIGPVHAPAEDADPRAKAAGKKEEDGAESGQGGGWMAVVAGNDGRSDARSRRFRFG